MADLYFIFICLSAILWLFLGIICIICLIQYIRIRKNEQCCIKRHSVLADIFTIILCNIIAGMSFIHYIPFLYTNIMTLLANILLSLIGIIYLEHSWIILYEIKFNEKLTNEEWRKLINNDIKQNWYVKNKATFGNRKYIRKILMIITSVFILIQTTCVIIYLSTSVFSETLFLFSIFITSIFVIFVGGSVSYFTCKIRKYDDVFLIVKQLQIIHVILIIVVLSAITCVVIDVISNSLNRPTIVFIIRNNLLYIGNTLIILINTLGCVYMNILLYIYIYIYFKVII